MALKLNDFWTSLCLRVLLLRMLLQQRQRVSGPKRGASHGGKELCVAHAEKEIGSKIFECPRECCCIFASSHDTISFAPASGTFRFQGPQLLSSPLKFPLQTISSGQEFCHAINCCLHLCPLAFLLLLFRMSILLWTCCGNSFSTSDFIHFSSASLLLWARVFVILSITAYTFVLLSFFCCCLESLCCSGPAVAIASSCSCSIDVVLLLGDDPCC